MLNPNLHTELLCTPQILHANASDIEIKINAEAVKLDRLASQLVAITEADTVCRNASLGAYHSGPTLDFPLDYFRHRQSSPPSRIIDRDSFIVGNDSDHSVLNDHDSALFVIGLSASQHPSRATNLVKRFYHPSDWGFPNRFASTFAMGFSGCDDTRGLSGHTLPSIARAGRPIQNPTKLDRINSVILNVVNSAGPLVHAYLEGSATVFYSDGTSSIETWSELERETNGWIAATFGTASVVNLSSLVELYLGLVEEKGEVGSKRARQKVAFNSLAAITNSDLEQMYHGHEQHNHFYSSFVSSPGSRLALPKHSHPNLHLPYQLRQGPNSLRFLADQEAESRKLVSAQEEASQEEVSAPENRQQKGKAKVKGQVYVRKTDQASPVGHGLRYFKLAMSSLPLPFGVSSIRHLRYPGEFAFFFRLHDSKS